ncbi:MAG: hypothetical protein AB2A00_41435 [Myxococcota bacterium]
MRRAWLSLLLLAACAAPPDLPAGPGELGIFRRHTDWRPPTNARVDLHAAPPSRLSRYAVSTNVGDIKVIEGDNTNVSTAQTNQGSGYGLRMDEGRQDLARITRQVIDEEGDHFDFIVVFPAFRDLLNPGFAYFSNIENSVRGIGLPTITLSQVFGSSGRLQGFLNMNTPEAYLALDGQPISNRNSAIYPIMGQEMTHRWLAFARVAKEGFQDGQPSEVLLGRDDAHWSALMHTGPVDMTGEVSCSVQDGVAWMDNGNGTFTVAEVFADPAFVISPRARFSTLDLYLMGLLDAQDVEPFYAITNARYLGQTVPPNARLEPGTTISGTRVDFTVEHVVAALGPRIPSAADAPREFNMAVVVLTQPGQTASQVADVVAEVDAFRVQWQEVFHAWTSGRATLCTALSGNCQQAQLRLEEVHLVENEQDGVLEPGEPLTVHALVRNTGALTSEAASVTLSGAARTSIPQPSAAVPPIPSDGTQPVSLTIIPAEDFPCGDPLAARMTLHAGGEIADSQQLDARVGVRTLQRFTMEQPAGFTVDPDGTDTAARGAWAMGAAHQTDLRQYGAPEVVFQPGHDSPDEGGLACFTDSGTDELSPTDVAVTDVDDGITTLQTPSLSLAGLREPTLQWHSWHTAIVMDLDNGQLREAEGDDLVTLVRLDEGAWVEVDRDDTNDFAWSVKTVRLNEVPGLAWQDATSLQVRFVVGDQGAEQNVVEAGVDQIILTDISPLCATAGSSTSSSGGGGSSSSSGGPQDDGDAGVRVVPGAPDPGVPRPPTCRCVDVGGPSWAALVPALLALIQRRRR